MVENFSSPHFVNNFKENKETITLYEKVVFGSINNSVDKELD